MHSSTWLQLLWWPCKMHFLPHFNQVAPVAGPSATLSWALAGGVCGLSALSYMELSARVPTKGSCYAFAFHALGELPAVVGAVCLTLEYGLSVRKNRKESGEQKKGEMSSPWQRSLHNSFDTLAHAHILFAFIIYVVIRLDTSHFNLLFFLWSRAREWLGTGRRNFPLCSGTGTWGSTW